MIAVHRPGDGELCGFVDQRDGVWQAMTIFGGRLGEHDGPDDARRHVLQTGLAALADRWTLVDLDSGEEEVVCIQEASRSHVTVALGYYSLPGVPSATFSSDDLADRWRLIRC